MRHSDDCPKVLRQTSEEIRMRKSISKRTRFNVLKRDKFTCQYCGRTAPTVTLHVDHIKPVARGGTNDPFNLIAACIDCNLAKSDKELDDNQKLDKQTDSILKLLPQLEENRQKLSEISKAQSTIKELEEEQFKFIERLIFKKLRIFFYHTEYFCLEGSHDLDDKDFEHMSWTSLEELKKAGLRTVTFFDPRKSIDLWIEKFGVAEVIESINIVSRKNNPSGCFNLIPRIAHWRSLTQGDETLEHLKSLLLANKAKGSYNATKWFLICKAALKNGASESRVLSAASIATSQRELLQLVENAD